MAKMNDYLESLDMDKLEYVLKIKTAFDQGELTLEEARKKLREKVTSLKPYEIAYIEQQFKEFDENECRKENIQKMLELYDGILDTSVHSLPKDHPIACYLRENEEMRKLLLAVEDLVQYPLIKNQWIELYEKLITYRIHLSRKQNQLYSILERKGFDRPTTTMWTLDDFIRDELMEAYRLLQQDNEEAFLTMQPVIVADVRDLIEKEDTVLYPTSLAMINNEEFEDMKKGDQEIGFAFIQVEKQTTIHQEKSNDFGSELSELLKKYGYSNGEKLKVAEGNLTLEQINLIYQHLPVDLSYVDENELVCFYSDTKHRVFPRSKNVIGRDVKNCHPRKSVHIVTEIIEKFRSGEQDEAEFWINKPELFIYIKYVAVRDEKGKFKGVLEMMQDCTHIRSLQGSRTLLAWDNAQQEEVEKISSEASTIDIESINADTKLIDLLSIKPILKDKLIEMSDKFKVMNSPLARVMLPKATIGKMSERSGYDLNQLIENIKKVMRES